MAAQELMMIGVAFACLIACVGSISNYPTQGNLVSEKSNVSVAVGGSAQLTCRILNLNSKNVVWRRGYEILTTGDILISADRRVSVSNTDTFSTLIITDLHHSDRGEYVCQISTIGQLVSTAFYLDILVGSRVVGVHSQVVARQGDTVTLQCNATGNPAPRVTWYRESDSVPLQSEAGAAVCPTGHCLTLVRVTAAEAGRYRCRADNGISGPASADISLTVQFPPVVAVPRESFISGVGESVTLSCTVTGQPQPTVTWNYDNSPLPPGIGGGRGLHTYRTASQGRQYTLQLDNIREEQFGNYSCQAQNALGTYKKHVEVHGRPGDLSLISEPWKSGLNHQHLTWTILSYEPVTEYRLLYRMIASEKYMSGRSSDWTNVIIPGNTQAVLQPRKKVSWVIHNLVPDSTYEALVQARNKYGWSGPSKRIIFNTNRPALKSASTQNFAEDVGVPGTQLSGQLRVARCCNLSLLLAIVLILMTV